jgi:predicted metal-binding protein
MTTTITICDTCKREGWKDGDISQTDGERMAALIEAAANGVEGVVTRRHSCLMGCGKGCNLAVQAEGKLTYVLGGFPPHAEKAEAVVEFARLHSENKSGQVVLRQRPEGVKGHFVSRLPVLDPPPE